LKEFYHQFAHDIVSRIEMAIAEERSFVAILPVGPVHQYPIAAQLINEKRLSLRNVHTFNMDEYANSDGVTAPASWIGSFQLAMRVNFFDLIDPDLRPPASQVHFPTTENLPTYSERLEELGGADVCYGGIGWCGHVAFWEPHLGYEFDGDFRTYSEACARFVTLHPMTIMQNALHSFGGDWSAVPPCANTVGPRDILSARHRSFWLDGDLGGGVSWQRFIARLVARGPVSPFVPGSMLQTASTDFTMVSAVADNVAIEIS
jgi:glucosamine-6-phosphate deaminase